MDTPLWIQIWGLKIAHIVIFACFLILIILVMVFKDRLSKKQRMLEIIRYTILGSSFL